MAGSLSAWKERIRDHLAAGWMRAKWAASQPVYAVVSSAALWPVFQALAEGDPAKLFPSLMSVTSAAGTNLVANQLQQWKDAPNITPAEMAEWVRQELTANPTVRAELDLINEKLDTILETRRSVGEQQWASLAGRLIGELSMLGNLPPFHASISGPVTVVQAGDRGVAVGHVRGGIVAQSVTVNIVGDRWEGTPGAGVEDNLEIYLRVLAATLSQVPLRGLDVGASEARQEQPRLGLAEVYVDLAMKTPVPVVEPTRGRELTNFHRMGDRPIRALEAVAALDRVVVLGDPGSGKSTLLNHLALCLAMHALDPAGGWLGRLRDWPESLGHLVPVVIILRDFARAISGTREEIGPRHLWAFIGQRLADQNLGFAEDPLLRALEGGNAIVLLDGMDEIPTGLERERIRDVVAAFARRYEKSRHVVSCRTLSYQDRGWRLEEWPTVELAPFDEDRIDRFIGVWHDELVRLGVIRTADARDLGAKLSRAVRRPDLWRLAPNPLLLTVIALVHTNVGELPEARAELYEQTVNMLLWRWDQLRTRRDEAPRIRELLAEAGRQALDLQLRLSELAFDAHGNGGAGDAERVADLGEGHLLRALASLHPAGSRDRDCLVGLPNHPVVSVSWHEARTYCDWLTEQLRASDRTPRALADLLHGRADGRQWRVTLPSEAEWEKAARGPAPSPRVYPWGDEPDPDAANYGDTGIGRTSSVGCFPKGKSQPYGVLDLAGNVWEWTRSLWGKDVMKPDKTDRYMPGGKTEDLKAPDEVLRVLWGGAFDLIEWDVRCAVRYWLLPYGRNLDFGFRVAVAPFVSDP